MIAIEFGLAIFLLVIVALGVLASEMDNFLIGTFTLICTFVGAEYLFDIPIWSTIKENPLFIVILIVGFIISGLLYVYAWHFPEHIKENKPQIQRDFADWKKYNSKEDSTFEDFLGAKQYKYSASNMIPEITAWTLVWPFALFWELARKPMKFVFNKVYAMCGEMFEKRSKDTARKLDIK